ncbi:hypothetical protein [Chryseobacterium sp. MP_3.2]|uniref:hypothetical protein n=1 Tax=Chryseobacterium sp. MP_3.2 TaxID=3071712 RepID=UPI002DFFD92F|nr:hypothetical protein [Chryseobacterium sp. MP_3.2]
MKKSLFLGFLIFASVFSAQEKSSKLGVFTSFDLNVGFDLGDIIRTNQAKDEYELSQLPPGKFNYGTSLLVGVQPLNWFSLSAGLRYSYIDPNYHLVYYKIQPNFYLGDSSDQDFLYLFANVGSKLNETAAEKASFVGVGIGKIEPLSKRFGHQFQVSLDNQIINREGNIFIGITYGIILFGNKNL